jgi:hypothetical protein
MIAAAFLIILFMLAVTLVVAAGLRRLVREESEVERRLRAPDTHTVSYAIPDGVDAGDLRVAVGRAGFPGMVVLAGFGQCLKVECAEGDRARLREAIEGAHESAYDGTELDLHPVIFEDERPSQA